MWFCSGGNRFRCGAGQIRRKRFAFRSADERKSRKLNDLFGPETDNSRDERRRLGTHPKQSLATRGEVIVEQTTLANSFEDRCNRLCACGPHARDLAACCIRVRRADLQDLDKRQHFRRVIGNAQSILAKQQEDSVPRLAARDLRPQAGNNVRVGIVSNALFSAGHEVTAL